MYKKPSEFINYPKAIPSRRAGAYLFDVFIALIVAIIINFITVVAINPSMGMYIDGVNKINKYADETNTVLSDSHLLQFEVDEKTNHLAPRDIEEVFLEYISLHTTDKITEETDPFMYYYLTFRKDNSIGEEDEYTMRWYNLNILELEEDPSDNTSILWEYTSIDSIATLKPEVKENLILYLDDELKTEVQKTYDDLATEYNSLVAKGLEDLYKTDLYKIPYNNYNAANAEVYFILSIELLISFTLGFLLIFIPFPFIFKNGQTIGKKVLGLAVKTNDEKVPAWTNILAKSGILYLESLFMVALLSLFGSGILTLVTSLFSVFGLFEFTLAWIVLFSSVLSILSFVLAAFSKNQLSLDDIVSGTCVVDIRYGEILEENDKVDESYKKKYDSGYQDEEMQILDSSIFNKTDEEN